jgi:3-oxo-5-alpha-steroid 4-dehydrogenase 1
MWFNIDFFNTAVIVWMAFGLLLLPVLLKISAPYGRHISNRWGPLINNRAGWIIMESPALWAFILFFLWGDFRPASSVSWLFFVLWIMHYTNRVLIFPFRLQTSGKKMPVVIMIFAVFFNLFNGFFNGMWLGTFGSFYTEAWLTDPRFISGLLLFFTGMYINITSDQTLLSLRQHHPGEYKIPQGGLYRYISCPNYFGEITEWAGFALMCWSPAALSFLIWTVVNLLPRALSHHRWYKEKFSDYPADRKAIIPFII